MDSNYIVQDDQTENGRIKLELLYLRNEYEKLFNFYQKETEFKECLETELKTVNEAKEEHIKETDAVLKKLHLEKKSFQEKFENKCIEVKDLKGEIETMKRENNSINVALKGSKKEIKEQNKRFEKKIGTLEKNA